MIAFDLQCSNGHVFEGWFDDLEAYENQAEKGLVQCPVCEDLQITRVPSTFGIKSSSGQESSMQKMDAEKAQHLLIKHLSEYVDKNFDNVGSNFATEALKIHYGVSEPRNIRGTSTKDEENLLKEEGVTFTKVPSVVKDETDA